jgi:hypothetical protein
VILSGASKIDWTEGRGGRGAHRREARIPARFTLAPCNLGDAAFTGPSRGDDEVRLVVARV